MAATTSNTTTTTTDEAHVETQFLAPDGTTDYGRATGTVRKTGTTFTLAVAFNADSAITASAAVNLIEYCEDAIEFFTELKAAVVTVNA
ncbi:MAG: hypothetical protein IJ783_05835 [Kiritimatiellae bacterium]|nr:hypothetical protein [Kiritimatiellia bacterium]